MGKNNEISLKIKQLRELLNQNLSTFARNLEIPRSTLVSYENGVNIPAELLSKISIKYGISEQWLLSGILPIFKETDNNKHNTLPDDVISLHDKANNIATNERSIKLTNYPNDEKNLHDKANKLSIDETEQTNDNEPQKMLNGVNILQDKALNKAPTVRRGTGGIPLVYEDAEGLDDGIVIPLLENAASAGHGADIDNDDTPVRYVQVPRHLSKYPHLASLPVKGDSMEPTLHDGDIVVCDGGGWDGDGIYVLKTFDTSYIKRVQITTKGYEVISDNKMYKNFTESVENLSIVGKVRAILVIVPGRRGGV